MPLLSNSQIPHSPNAASQLIRKSSLVGTKIRESCRTGARKSKENGRANRERIAVERFRQKATNELKGDHEKKDECDGRGNPDGLI